MASSYSIDEARIVRRLGAERVQQLTDDANLGSIDSDVVDEMIDLAEDEFHHYAGKQYVTPLRTITNTTPGGLLAKLVNLTCWWLVTRRPDNLKNDNDEGQHWEKRRKELIAWLEDVQAGKQPIAGAVMTDQVAEHEKAEVVSSAPRFAGLDSLMS